MPKVVSISAEVRDVLSRAIVEGSAERPVLKLPDEQLSRTLYEAVAKVLRALGGKWTRSAGGFLFDRPFEGELAVALASGKAIDAKRTAEQFFTPPDLARRMAGLLEITPGAHILEPSAGDGRLIDAAREAGAEFFTVVEQDERLRGALEDRVGAHSGGVWIDDFLSWKPVARAPIDFVIMNPPFSKNQDIAHVERAFGFLRPGGALVAIMSPHFEFAQDEPSRRFRELIERETAGRYASVEPIEAGTFKEAGTMVRTVLVLLRKRS